MSESKEGWAERRAETRREWDRIIKEFEATGMTGAAFCRDRGFPEWKFSYWRKVRKRLTNRMSAGRRGPGHPAARSAVRRTHRSGMSDEIWPVVISGRRCITSSR